MTISLYLGNNLATLDILSSPIENTVVIPPRSQSIRKLHLKYGIGTQEIESQEISAGVFLTRTIVDRKNTYVKVLNTTDKPVVIPNNTIKHQILRNSKLENFENNSIF